MAVAPAVSAPVQEDVYTPASSREEWRTFWRFFRYCYPYKDKIILSLLTIFIGVPMTQIGVFMGRYLVDEVVLNTKAPTDWRIRAFFVIIAAQVGMWGIGQTMAIIREVMGYHVDLKVTLHIRRLFYTHLHSLSLNFFRTRPIGEHMYRSVYDTGMGGLVTMITRDLPDMMNILYNVIWGAVLLSVVDWRITLLVLAYILPYTLLSYFFYSRLQDTLRAARTQEQEALAALRDGIAGAKTVKGFGRIAHQVRKYVSQLIITRRVHLRWYFLNVATHHFALWGLLWVVEKIKWLYIVFQTMNGNMSLGEFSVTFWLIWQFQGPMQQIVLHVQNIRLRIVFGQRVLETLDVPIEIQDAPDAKPLSRAEGRVEFENVTFEYLLGRPVLKNVSFTLEPGMTAAFVGPSGAGKSTIMHLLMRLYEPTQGRVRVDGCDLREIQLNSWQHQVGVVLQDTFLFGGTIRDNIRYGKLNASDEEVSHAAWLADLHDFITKLPKGYDTDLGEGTKLSGGEKQRIGIARALVRNPQVLILDEPTANLDSRHEDNLVRTFERVCAGRTTLIVSHRLVTVTNADVIFVLKDGAIVEQGTHDELLTRNGLYARLWEEQTKLGGVTRKEFEE